MRVLLSTIGSRGDVQPLVALAVALRDNGEEVRLCVPPDFRAWIESLGFAVTAIGPELRSTGKAAPLASLTPEQRRQMIEGTVAAQFETIATAAEDCDLIVGATALQVAAPSVAERTGIPYVFAAYSPNVLPSPRHAPPAMLGQASAAGASDYTDMWMQDARRWNDTWGDLLNRRREALGLTPVSDVRAHVLTERPWLAADPTLAPWPDPAKPVFQPGAWILADERPLSPEIESFLSAGAPPIYFGFGSVRAPNNLSQAMIESARAVGGRAILSAGWAELALIDDAPDCMSIGEVNQQALFRRVACVVHHGGAGTTTAATRAGTPQVIIPQLYDQHYFAERVQHLGVGSAHAPGAPTTESLTAALERSLHPDVAARARLVAAHFKTDGARIAAARLATVQT
jgi:vancomycin aglycone glucosyltransferase